MQSQMALTAHLSALLRQFDEFVSVDASQAPFGNNLLPSVENDRDVWRSVRFARTKIKIFITSVATGHVAVQPYDDLWQIVEEQSKLLRWVCASKLSVLVSQPAIPSFGIKPSAENEMEDEPACQTSFNTIAR